MSAQAWQIVKGYFRTPRSTVAVTLADGATVVASCFTDESAARIVTAVNAFDKTREALRLAYALIASDYRINDDSGEVIERVARPAWDAICEALAAMDAAADKVTP